MAGGDPIRFEEVIAGRPAPKGYQIYARQVGSAGIAAVWARENTRVALWDAMACKEVFATTGNRLRVRVFGGFNYTEDDLVRSDFAKYGYDHGVPIGGDLKKAPKGKAPTFLIRALRDPDGANLGRVQVVKGWMDASGKLHEKANNVALSGDRKPDKDGKLPLVGNTVNVKDATYTNAIGALFLSAYWKDPAFDAKERVFYYVRVIEIPTPRWTTYDAKIFGVKLPDDVSALRELVVARHGVVFGTTEVVMKLDGRSLKSNAVINLRASEPTPKNLVKFDPILIRLASLLLCSVS